MLIVKIEGPVDDAVIGLSTQTHLILAGVVQVQFIRDQQGCWADVYLSSDEAPTTYPIGNAAYVMNESGRTISSFVP